MCFVEDQRMRNPSLDPSAEHVLVQPVEDKEGKRTLQVLVLCGVDTDDNREFAFPQAALRLGVRVEETVVIQLAEAREQCAQPTVRSGLAAKELQETPEDRLWSSRVRVPACLLEAVFDGSADAIRLNIAELRVNRGEDVPHRAGDIQMSHP